MIKIMKGLLVWALRLSHAHGFVELQYALVVSVRKQESSSLKLANGLIYHQDY